MHIVMCEILPINCLKELVRFPSLFYYNTAYPKVIQVFFSLLFIFMCLTEAGARGGPRRKPLPHRGLDERFSVKSVSIILVS